MIKNIALSISLCFPVLLGFSQNMRDAYRLSNVSLQGTARATAMGNAFGALGGDFTSTSINPAGMGLYNSSELAGTFQVGNFQNRASYLGLNTPESETNFSMPSLAYVFSMKTDPRKNSSLVAVNWGIGYNRMANFNTSTIIKGKGANSSMLDFFAENANTGNGNIFFEEVAAGAGAIYQYNGEDENGKYTSPFFHDMQVTNDWDEANPSRNFAHDQRKTIYQSGSQDEYVFSLGFNLNHRVYFGATLGVQDVRFNEVSTMSEGNVNYEGHREAGDFNSYLNNYEFRERLETWGTGVNAKFGVIVKPIEQLRLGAAIHTPTSYSLHDGYDTYMRNDYDARDESGRYINYIGEASSENTGEYDYTINSPMKAVFSAAYVLGKRAIFSVDYEYVDYSKMKLKRGGDGYDFDDENSEISSTFQSVGNWRAGAEVRLTEALSLRAGYEYMPGTYQEKDWRTITESFSAGLGYRFGQFYVDAAYKYLASSSRLNLYDVPLGVNAAYDQSVNMPVADIKHCRNLYTLTFGMRF